MINEFEMSQSVHGPRSNRLDVASENAKRKSEDRANQITNIQRKLGEGKLVLKDGHKIRQINPEGVAMVVELPERKRERMERELRFLREAQGVPSSLRRSIYRLFGNL